MRKKRAGFSFGKDTEEFRRRIHVGLKRAVANGTRLGRPEAVFNKAVAMALIDQGWSNREIAEALNVSRGVIDRFRETISGENTKETDEWLRKLQRMSLKLEKSWPRKV